MRQRHQEAARGRVQAAVQLRPEGAGGSRPINRPPVSGRLTIPRLAGRWAVRRLAVSGLAVSGLAGRLTVRGLAGRCAK